MNQSTKKIVIKVKNPTPTPTPTPSPTRIYPQLTFSEEQLCSNLPPIDELFRQKESVQHELGYLATTLPPTIEKIFQSSLNTIRRP
jgi:hypothetical protein